MVFGIIAKLVSQMPSFTVMAAENTTEQGTRYQSMKRKDYLTWDEYFMSIAILSGRRSKDPKTQVGACIVNNYKENIIVGTGYNGMPRGCHDDDMPWGKDAPSELENKNFYVVHAEANAILNRISTDIKESRIYVSLFPCAECAKLIIQSGIKEIVFLTEREKETYEASHRMLRRAGIKLRRFPDNKEAVSEVNINFKCE